MTSPEQLFTNFEAKMAAAQQKAELMRAEIENVSVSERSKDGQILVRVNHAGNLTGLEIGPNAREKPDLAQEILRTVRLAQSRLADAVQAGVPSIAGSETMGQLVDQLHNTYPEPEPEGSVEGGYRDRDPRSDLDFVPEEDTPPVPPPTPKPEAKPRPRRPETDGDAHDDDYFTGGDFLND